MLSIQTEARVVKLLLEIAKGENAIESARRMMTNNYDFDAYQIFNFLDIEKKNRLDSLDIVNYMTYKNFSITDLEAQLIIIFYDQNYDGVLTFDEFANLVKSKNSLNSKLTAKFFTGKISKEIDESLFNILEKEVKFVRNCLSLLKELKTRKDFNAHSIYHLLRGNNCINEESIKDFLLKKDAIFSEDDLAGIRRRLDINKDGKIDLCELHAFLGYPECSICCPSTPCPTCDIKDCNFCFKDSVCFFHNRVHDDFFSRNQTKNNNKGNNYKRERPSYMTYLPESNINIDNDNPYSQKNLEFSNKSSPLREGNINNKKENFYFQYGNNENYNNINNINNVKNINNNYDYYQDEINNNQNIAKYSSPRKISNNLVLRASPERKFSPYRISSLGSNDSNIINSSNSNIDDYINEKYRSDESQFLNYLKEAMKVEQKIEENKIKLCLNDDFNCEDAFRIFENERREFLAKDDLKYGLNLLNLYPSNKDLDIIINKYSLQKKGILEYGDFFDIVVPYEKEYRNKIENRIPNSSVVVRSPSVFSYNTGLCLKELLNLIIKEESRLNDMRREFSITLKNDLNLYFNNIDVMNNRKLDQKDLLDYLQKMRIFIDENACDLLFIRLDSNRNGTIELSEIEKEFKSVFN